MLQHVARLFWEYRHYGIDDFQVEYLITKLTFNWAGGSQLVFNVPYNGLFWRY